MMPVTFPDDDLSTADFPDKPIVLTRPFDLLFGKLIHTDCLKMSDAMTYTMDRMKANPGCGFCQGMSPIMESKNVGFVITGMRH
jgi:hypothetical protein